MTTEMTGKVAVVTGAGAGIGRAVALAFGLSGARVMVCDVDENAARATVGLIEAAGGAAAVVGL